MIFRASILLLCLIAPAFAQDLQITPDMKVDSATLQSWLHSNNPRLIAWAADFARRRHDEVLLSQIRSLLEHWSEPPITGGYEEHAAQRRALLALLDALIQSDTTVSLPVIEGAAERFPAQSVLLIQHIPVETARSILMNWTFEQNGSINGKRARASAMMLARSPDSPFVYNILRGLVQHVTIRIVPPNTGYGGASSTCGDSLVSPPTPGWPAIYTYRLLEDTDNSKGEGSNATLVVEIGHHAIYAERREENSGWGECSTPQSDAAFRHELVSYWLGVKPSEMSWQPEQSLDIVWTKESAYEREMGSFLEKDRIRMSSTLLQLRDRRLLDAKMIDGTFPQISISFECDLIPCPLPKVPKSKK